MHNKKSIRAQEVFLPTPHRMNVEAVQDAPLLCNAQLPSLVAKIRACGSTMRFDEHVEKLKAVIRKSWIVKVKPNPLQNTAMWSATAKSVSKWSSKVVRRALSPEGKIAV